MAGTRNAYLSPNNSSSGPIDISATAIPKGQLDINIPIAISIRNSANQSATIFVTSTFNKTAPRPEISLPMNIIW